MLRRGERWQLQQAFKKRTGDAKNWEQGARLRVTENHRYLGEARHVK